MKMPKILFFIAGMAPTAEETETALEIGAVAFRNRSLISDSDNPEKADAVAGEVIPAPYKDYPVVKSLAAAINIIREKQKAENAAAASVLASDKAATQVVGTESPAKGQETPPREGLGGTGNNPNGSDGGTKQGTPAAGGWKKNA